MIFSIAKFILFVFLILTSLFAVNYLNLESYLKPSVLREMVMGYGLWGPLIFILMYIAATVFFLPGSPLTVAGGALFGGFYAGLYVLIGATIGATTAFFVSRVLGEGFVEWVLKKNRFEKVFEYDKKLEKNGLAVMLFFRLIPLFPFNGLNFVLGLTKVRSKDYILGTFLGIIPGTFAYAYFGDSLASFNLLNTLWSLVVIILLAVSFPVYRKIKNKNLYQVNK